MVVAGPQPLSTAALDLGLSQTGLTTQVKDEAERRKQEMLTGQTGPQRDPTTGLSPAVSALLGM